MTKSYIIPEKPGVHLIEHFCGNYFGSASFVMDLAARLASPEKIIIISHKDLDPGEAAEGFKYRCAQLGKTVEKIGRVVFVGGDGLEDCVSNNEVALFPGMEMVILVDTSGLSGALKYLYNGSENCTRWVSVICTVQCGFNKTIKDILKRECSIGSCLFNSPFYTYLYGENRLPYDINGNEKVSSFDVNMYIKKCPIISDIMAVKPISSIKFFNINHVGDTISS